MCSQGPKRIGYWLSQKKCKKLSVPEMEESLRSRGIEPVKIDLSKPIADQGPFDAVLHKLTDFIAQAENGDVESERLITGIQAYARENPNMLLIDSIDSLKNLINRFKTYCIIDSATSRMEGTSFVPKFVELHSNDYLSTLNTLQEAGVTFPAVCKPIVAHGSGAHQMTLIFNQKGLHDIAFPCVLQSFVNHNAVLYKLFAIGEKYFLIERPSIKNFYDCADYLPIHFAGNEVSKADSVNALTVQDKTLEGFRTVEPSPDILHLIVKEIGKAINVRLFGVDIVIEESRGRYAILDVNAFPGYDGVTHFPDVLAEYIKEELDKQVPSSNVNCTSDGVILPQPQKTADKAYS